FRKITIETNSGGKFVAQEVERLSRENGGLISVEYKSNAGAGARAKKVRVLATLIPKYELKAIFHRRDGLTSVLEEEIILENPPHDDLLDALSMAVEVSKPPMKTKTYIDEEQKVITDSRFGGRAGR